MTSPIVFRNECITKEDRFIKRLFGTVLLTVMLTVAAEGRAVVLSLESSRFTVNPGDSVTLDLTVSGLGNLTAPSLGAFDIDIGYDPAKLSFTGYTLGNWLGNVSQSEALDASKGDSTPPGVINLAEVSLLTANELDALQPDSFVLATLDFTVTAGLAAGQSTVGILPTSVLADGSAGSFSSVNTGNSVTLTPQAPSPAGGVPEPATWALLVIGLGMIRKISWQAGHPRLSSN